MATDDYNRVLFLILYSLYQSLKEGKKPDFTVISSTALEINEGYWVAIIEDAVEEGLIKGPIFRKTNIGTIMSGKENMRITRHGVNFLQDNSQMKKAYNALKEVLTWIKPL